MSEELLIGKEEKDVKKVMESILKEYKSLKVRSSRVLERGLSEKPTNFSCAKITNKSSSVVGVIRLIADEFATEMNIFPGESAVVAKFNYADIHTRQPDAELLFEVSNLSAVAYIETIIIRSGVDGVMFDQCLLTTDMYPCTKTYKLNKLGHHLLLFPVSGSGRTMEQIRNAIGKASDLSDDA